MTEFPIFGRREGGELGWLILELDRDYVRDTWLPELIRHYLDPGDQRLNDIAVRSAGDDIFRTASFQSSGTPDVSHEFNLQGRTRQTFPGPGRPAWTFEVWHRAGALDAIVTASRQRNLVIAGVFNLLILAAGGLLLRYTRHSRELAETQMRFVANVSHELRTPLTVIRGAAHNLRRGVVREPAQIEKYSGMILDHTEQLTGMVEQVLAYAGAHKNSGAVQRQPVAVEEILRQAIANTAPEAEHAKCKVELSPLPELPQVDGDAAALRRALENLLINAARHGGAGGWIGVRARLTNGAEPPAIEVQVSDRGSGISESEQAEIFKPFTRGARAVSEQVRGSGLGLSLVREIVELHGGTVAVTSAAGQGATFTIRLPAL